MKLKKASEIPGNPNECLRHNTRRTLVHLTLSLVTASGCRYFPFTWKETKPRWGSKIPSEFTIDKPPVNNGQYFWERNLKKVQKHLEINNLLIASQFGFCARHSTTLQCVTLTDHVTLNFNNMSPAAVFLDIAKALDRALFPGLLHKLLKLQFLASDKAY